MTLTLERIADELVGKEVLALTHEPGSGTLFDLGSWVRRPRPVRNPNLSERLQEFQGTDLIFVMCQWELDTPDVLVPAAVTPGDPRTRTRARMELLNVLEGHSILTIRKATDPDRLTLGFDGATQLTVFPIQPGPARRALAIHVRDEYWVWYSDGRTEAGADPRLRDDS